MFIEVLVLIMDIMRSYCNGSVKITTNWGLTPPGRDYTFVISSQSTVFMIVLGTGNVGLESENLYFMVMKKAILLFILTAILFNGSAQIPSNCDVSPLLRTYYELDVKDMALKWLYSIKSPDTSQIDIPQWCQDTIWSGLAALFNRCDIPEVDSVFNKYCVHTDVGFQGSGIFKYMGIDVDTLINWTHKWINYQITTGITTLDSLLAKYGFTVDNVYHWSNSPPTVLLATTQLINTPALCDSLRSFQGILSAEPIQPIY